MDLQDRLTKMEETMAALAFSQQEILGHITKRMEQFIQHIFGKSKDDRKHSTNKGNGRNGVNFDVWGSLNNYVPKTFKIDFPHYDSQDDPTTWVSKVEKYFSLQEIIEFYKVTLASFYLEGEAQLRSQILEELMYVTQEDLKQGIFSHFNTNQFENMFNKLIQLQKTGSVIDYQIKFENHLLIGGMTCLGHQDGFSLVSPLVYMMRTRQDLR